jgi:hypothetical protein
MASPVPKPKSQRARRNADLAPQIDLEFQPADPPELPTTWIDKDGNLAELKWSPLTENWWQSWCTSPQAKIFSPSDWQSLLSTAFVADKFFRTFEVRYASELRQREAQFGATPLDRLRLRMAWMEDKERGFKVSEAEEKRRQKEAQQRYAGLRAVGTDT